MLTVNEIFHSIQGESTRAGDRCVFVRLTACDLRCSWCDTPYAFHEGRKMSVDDVMSAVEAYGCPLVEITGGEPLLQEGVYELMDRLLAAGHTVLLETGGHRPIDRVPPDVVKIVDVKCPGSGEADKNRLGQPRAAGAARRGEVRRARSRGLRVRARRRARTQLPSRAAAILFSPVHDVLDPKTLSEWVIADRLPVRVQLQLHKLIWSPHHARRVTEAVVLLSGGLDSYTAAAMAQGRMDSR